MMFIFMMISGMIVLRIVLAWYGTGALTGIIGVLLIKGNPQDKPVIAYWRWYNRGGYVKELNFAERMLAYGITSVKHDGPNGAFSFKIAALPERTLYVGLDGKGLAAFGFDLGHDGLLSGES